MHAPLAQRTEPYTSPAALSTCKHSAIMYCMYSLSALNPIPHCTSSATLHYTLRPPLTLPQRTELFVSLSLLSLPPLPMYMGLLACPSLGSLPSYTPSLPGSGPLWGAAEGRRDPSIDLSKWGIWLFWTLYVYPYHARARGIGISAYLGTCPFPIHIGLRPLRATNHYLEVLHKRGVLCGTEFLRDSLGSMVRPKVSLFGQLVH